MSAPATAKNVCKYGTCGSKALWAFLGALLSFGALPVTAQISDDFNAPNVDTGLWIVANPLGDGTIVVDAGQLELTVPAGTPHVPGTAGNDALRIVQNIADEDFAVEVKFASVPALGDQLQGIIIEQDSANFLRFDFHRNGTSLSVFAAGISAGATTFSDESGVPGTPAALYLRVTRAGNQWTQEYSTDGSNWVIATVRNHAIQVARVGPFVANTGASAPAFTGVIDYFFDSLAPIAPEDGGVPPSDTTVPLLTNVVATRISDSSALVSWTADEMTTGEVFFGTTPGYELGSLHSPLADNHHSVTFSGLAPQSTYNFQIVATDDAGNTATSQNTIAAPIGAPTIELWHGPSQSFGVLGEPQVWLNVLGRVTDIDGLQSFAYRLNGQGPVPLNVGSDTRRLENAGDFNIDLAVTDLLAGNNEIAITATDSTGKSNTSTLVIDYTPDTLWPLPYGIDWSTVTNIQDVAQVIDGNWTLEPNGVRTAEAGYDRIVALGGIEWTNYEVTAPVTVHGINPTCSISCSSSPPGIGLIARWQGHHAWSAERPYYGWFPLGALGWFRYDTWGAGGHFNILGGDQGLTLAQGGLSTLPFGVPHVFKLRAETVDGQHQYSLKVWPQSTPEPAGWMLVANTPLSDLGNGSVLLVAHHVNATFGDVAVAPITPAPDTVPPVIGNIAVTASPESATVLWATDEAATSSVSYGTTTAYELGTLASGTLVTSHGLTVTGLAADTGYHFRITSTDAAGNSTQSADQFVQTTVQGGTSGGVVSSDEFDGAALNGALWTAIDPHGDGTVQMSGTQLSLSVPGGTAHDVWSTGNDALRVMQPIADEDFEVEVKFDSTVSAAYQLQGLLVEASAGNFLRYDVYSTGTATMLFAATFINGSPTIRLNTPVSGSAPYLRIERNGDVWTLRHSTDGAVWQTAATFSQPLGVSSIGVFAGNAGSAPAHTALVDYFRGVGTPPPADEQPPLIANVVVTPGETTASLSWTTDEPASSAVSYGPSAAYELGTLTQTALQTSHSVTLTGLSAATTYHFSLGASDGAGNAAASADASFTTDAAAPADLDPPLIANVVVTPGETTASLSWTTDEPASSAVSYGPSAVYELGTLTQAALQTSHSVTLTGLSAATTYHFSLGASDGAGNAAASADASFTTDNAPPPAGGLITADEFDGAALNGALWAAIDPHGDGTVQMSGTQLSLSVPGGTAHDVWSTGNDALRVMQPIADEDFEVEVKFDSTVSAAYQLQGLLVEASAGNFLRYDVYSTGTATMLFAATFSNGSPTIRLNTPVSGSAPYLRIARSADTWTLRHSTDGLNWQTAATFSQPLGVSSIGVFAGNAGSAPAHTALVDYFRGVGTPPPADEQPPLIANVVVTPGETTASLSWTTDEPASSAVSYGPSAAYELGTLTQTALQTSHSVTLTGLSAATTYHFSLGASDGAGNAAASADASFTTDAAAPADLDPPLIANVVVTPGETTASLSWTTDEPASSAVSYGPSAAYELGTLTQAALQTSHSVTLTGLSAATTYHFSLGASDGAGNAAASADASFTTAAPPPPPAGGLVTADEFDGAALNGALWAAIDPRGDGTVQMSGTQLSLSVPGGTAHDVWTAGNDALRVMQPIADEDFEVEVKFDSTVSAAYQLQGLLVEASAGNFLRYDVYSTGTATMLFAATFSNGSPTIRLNTPVSGSAPYLRIARSADTWTLRHSTDGLNWQTAATFSQPLGVSSIGLFAGNAGNAPAHTALVDYFRGVGTPPPADEQPPLIANVVVTPGETTASLSWTTDEPASSAVSYGPSAAYELGTLTQTALQTSHSVTLTGLSAATTYHFSLGASDGAGNAAASADASFTTDNAPAPASGLVSADEFDGAALNGALWTAIDPRADGTVQMSGTQLSLSVPGVTAHDVWTAGNDALRVMQPIADEDFEVEVKFDSTVSAAYQLQGLLVEASPGNFLRYDFYSTGSATMLFAATFSNGSPTVRLNTPVSGNAAYLRIARSADTWTLRYSADGLNWQTAATFSQPLGVSSIGLFAGNAGNAPAHTALVDYLRNVSN